MEAESQPRSDGMVQTHLAGRTPRQLVLCVTLMVMDAWVDSWLNTVCGCLHEGVSG